MTDDIIVIVPPGTRVRYMESTAVGDNVYAIDAQLIHPGPPPILGSLGPPLWSTPVYDAERYGDG